jgi:predicted phage tail protein
MTTFSNSSLSSGRISGASGKSGSSVSFVETPNSLRSASRLRLLAIVSAGPIEGLATGASSLKVDGVPVVSPSDGSTNIGGINWEITTGDDDISSGVGQNGFNAVEQTQSVAANLLPNRPYTRSGQGDSARLTFRFPRGLVRQTEVGIFGSSVQIAIDVRQADGQFLRAATSVIAEKQTAFFELQFTVDFTQAYDQGFTPAIRVRRLTPSSDDSNVRDDVSWASVTWIKRDRLSYAGLSTLALTVDADTFGNRLPRIELDVKGRQLRVPNNYDASSRTYSGIWSGGFKLVYSNNPVWVVFDLLTDRNWGLGLSDQVIEVYDLYTMARYADEMVADGRGGNEPRFIFDAVLNRRQSAYGLIQQICAGMRAMMFWSGGRLRFIQDKPQDAVMWLTNHHVEGGLFVYTTSGSRTQYSHALVSFQDSSHPDGTMVEAETRPEVLAKTGYAAKEVALLGCRRRSQARRHARWLLDKADASLHGVSWRAGLDHFAANPIRPGDVVRVVDGNRLSSQQWSGRMNLLPPPSGGVLFNTALTITRGFADYETENNGWQVNQPVTIAAADGDNGAGDNVMVTPVEPWPHPPVDQGAMVIKAVHSSSAGQDYRVVALRELDRNRVEVDAIRHDNSRFSAIETDLTVPLEAKSDRPDFSTPVPAPTGLQIHQPAEVSGKRGLRNLMVAWTPPIDHRISHWKVTGRGADGEAAQEVVSSSPAVLSDLVAGKWALSVQAVDWVGNSGLALTGQATVSLDPVAAEPPPSPRLSSGFGQLVLEWDASEMPQGAAVDVLEYTSATATAPTIISAVGSPVVLAGRMAGIEHFFRLRTRLQGGSISTPTVLLSAAALALPRDGIDGTDGTDGAAGATGAPGTVMARAAVTEAIWADSAATVAVRELRGGDVVKGDLVTLSFRGGSAAAPWAETRVYDGEGWVQAGAVLTGDALADGTVAASRLKLDESKLAMSASGDELTIKAVPADLISTGVMRSANYQQGVQGFSIDTTGTAEFNDAVIRGVLESSRVEGSTLIAATSVIPTENQQGFFTLEHPRMLYSGQRVRTSRKLTIGPLSVIRERHGRRFGDGGRIVLAANNPFNGRDSAGRHQPVAAGGYNSYYTRFWHDSPSVIIDMSYVDTSPSGGITINSGSLRIGVKTSGGRRLARSSLIDFASLLSWGAARPNITTPLRLLPPEGFNLGTSGRIFKETKGRGQTDEVSLFRIGLDLRVAFLHVASDGLEDGLVIEVELNIGSAASSAVISAFYDSFEIDASTQA